MARKNEAVRGFNVAVVGLSGTEKEKGQAGIGKSCLCNRFMRSLADDYSVDHISVLSQTDFSGRVVNNDHFLYWGETSKYSEEGMEFLFQVIEQTEFIDDASFQPFKGGKMEPYVKRCSATKLTSAEKLMYICKNQLGIEKEYEQKLLPDGKISIDGFVCVFDVSAVPNRTLEKQVETVTTILNNLIKTKKPIVLVTTKNDDANESYVKEAERIVTRKEYKGSILLIETSAHENINVDLAFIALAQVIDRTKGRTKVLPFIDAARTRKEILEHSTENFQRMIRSQVTDYRSVWSYTSKKLAQHDEFIVFVELFGMDTAQRLFRRHIKKLKDEHLAKKVEVFMVMLPDILQEMVPDLSTLRDKDWPLVQQHIKDHPEFNQYFFECPEDMPWIEYDLTDMNETRIPFEVLDTSEAETVYKNHVNALQQEQKRLEWKKQFKRLLEDTGYVTPGKFLSEVRVLFMGRECFEALTESDCQHIYDQHQKDIVEKAKHNFQELLLEHADLFYHFKSIAPTGTITQDDIKEITDALQEDFRYKSLDRLDQDRKLMLFQHLGFVHCPIREHCPAFPNCMDALIERILGTKAHRPSSWNHSNQWLLNSDNNQLNLVILGIDGLANELASEIRVHCDDDEYEIDCRLYSLDYRIIDGDVSLPQNSFQTSKFLPNGCFCVYSNPESFEYVRESVEKTLLSNLEQEDRLPFQGLPIVIMFIADPALEEKKMMGLREEGQSLADSLQCPFMDVSQDDVGQRFNASLIHEALHQLLQSIHHRAGVLSVYQHPVMDHSEPDIRIIMCMFCGDPYSVENILGPLLSHQCCFLSGERSIVLETFLGDSKRKVEVIISSFHGANAFREELVHGFVLVYSTKRKASLATLNAFSMNIPNLPIQILAVTDSGGANAFFSSDLSHLLITEGNATADRLQAHFMTSTSSCQQKTAFYTPFFKEVWEKKPEIEQAFHMEEPLHLNDSEDGTLERVVGPRPLPPPRHESYNITTGSNEGLFRLKSSNKGVYRFDVAGTNGHQWFGRYRDRAQSARHCMTSIVSGSEIYERLPTDDPNGEPDDRMLSPSDDSDIYSHVDVFNQDNELLVKPSDVKSSRKLHLDRGERDDGKWMSSYRQHAFTTGRRHNNHVNTATAKTRPKGGSQTLKQPGKLNLKEFSVVTDAIAKMNLGGKESTVAKLSKAGFGHAPLATPENVDLGSDYAQVKDALGVAVYPPYDDEYSYSSVQDALAPNVKAKLRQRREKGRPSYTDSDSDWSSLERRQRAADMYCKVNRKGTPHKRIRKKRTAIPVATPRVPPTALAGAGGPGQQATVPLLSYQIKEEASQGPGADSPGEKVHSETPSDLSEVSDPEVSSSATTPRQKFHKRSLKLKMKPPGVAPPIPIPPEIRNTAHHNLQHQFSSQLQSDHDIFTSAKLKMEYGLLHDDDSSLDVSSPRDLNSPMGKDDDKTARRKEKQKAKADEKQEKRRQKEEKLKKLAEKEKEREKKKSKQKVRSGAVPAPATLEDFVQSETNAIPLLLEKCVKFIEDEGLDSEGIYRVPGNRAHVDLLFQKFEEDPNLNIHDLDIPVNAVATALKDFFSKRLPPLLTQEMMGQLEDISGARRVHKQGSTAYLNLEVITDRSCRLLHLRGLLKRLPNVNFEVLKFVFQHFVKVSENCKLNSMDSKNLAICWWPTLLPIEFSDMGRFEQMRPHLEDIVQTMIDQYPFLFCGKEAFVMV